jgi:hypothetical protein
MRQNTIFKKPQLEGERLSTADLIQFIKMNRSKIEKIDYIDLNELVIEKSNELELLRFQDVKTITKLPPKLHDFFDIENTKYFHAGSLHTIPDFGETDISLFSSVLICLHQNFFMQNTLAQQKFVSGFIISLQGDTKKFNYNKYGWTKENLYNWMKNGPLGSQIIKYLSDYLCINIFILDIEEDKLMFGGGDEYYPYRKTIFLIKYNGNKFEPLYTEAQKFFSVNSKIIKKISQNKKFIKIYPLSATMKQDFVECLEDLSTYIPSLEQENPHEEQTNNEETPKYTQKELKLLKIAELQEIAEKKGIDIKIGAKKKTKECLINEILQ